LYVQGCGLRSKKVKKIEEKAKILIEKVGRGLYSDANYRRVNTVMTILKNSKDYSEARSIEQ